MNQGLEIRGGLLAKNTILNFMGQVIPLLVALVTVPYVIKGLGAERFGILSLAWVVVGYFSILDLGLGRATTKFVAEALGRKEIDKIPGIVGTSLIFVVLLSLIGMAILMLFTPLLVEHVLNVPSYMIEETRKVFYIISVSILITLITATLNGVLEAYQRFDIVNMLRASSSVLSSIIPAVAIFYSSSLPLIVILLLIKNFVMLLFYFLFCRRTLPTDFISVDFKIGPKLWAFGGWITSINVISPVLVHIDRFLIASLLSMSAVTYYTPPYTVVSKLWIFPMSLFMTLFPAFSVIGITNKEQLERIFARALKYLMLVTGPIILILFLFAGDILRLWLGEEFATRSTVVFQILAVGFFINSLAWVPSTLFQGIGRADIVAKIFLLEAPLYVGVVWWLIGKMGIEGAALAWALRGGVETVLLFIIVFWKVVSLRFSVFVQNGVIRSVIALGGLILTASVMELLLHTSWLIHAIVIMGLIVLFVLTAWHYTLDAGERSELKTVFLPATNKRGVVK